MESFDKTLLINTWIHSHEDDVDDLRTFRCEGFDFPPSRGRRRFTLDANGVLIDQTIRRQDGVGSTEGSWTIEANMLTFKLPTTGEIIQIWNVVSLELEKLVLRSIRSSNI